MMSIRMDREAEQQFVLPILVNPDDSQDPEFPYGRTFYPGVQDRASAWIITLGGGEQIEGTDIQVEKRFTPRRLTVRVTLGGRAANQRFCIR